MYLSLLIIGVVLALAGAAMVALGIPINEFGLGNALITAGTTAFAGGLILVGLSQVVKQLRRIAENLGAVSDIPVSHIADLSEPAPHGGPRPPPGAPRIPFPPKPAPRTRAPAPVLSPEPRLDLAPSLDAAEEPSRPPPGFVRKAPEPRVMPERDEAPLSPAEPRFAAPPEPRFAAPPEPRFSTAREQKDELSEGLLATAFSRLDMTLRQTPPASVETPKQNEPFESSWPAERRNATETEAEPEPTQPVEAEAPEPEPPVEKAEEREQSEEPYAVSILKSGVVDGMAYTLYSDGSIEAEMPQGTMRFASITELRAYLEKSSS
jgi:hypothetical protein